MGTGKTEHACSLYCETRYNKKIFVLDINGAANQLFLNWSTLQWCKNVTKNHHDDEEFYKILNRYTKIVNFDL